MSIRSILALGLLAVPAVLGTPVNGNEKTKTKTVTVTKTAKASTVTVYAPCSASASRSTSVSTSFSTSTSRTSSAGASSAGASSAGSSVATPATTAAATATTMTTTVLPTLSATMAAAAKKAGRYFGTAVDIPGTGEAQDPYYMAIFNNSEIFNQATPANVMKWFSLEPQRGVFDYTGADYFVNLAQASNKLIRCHNLLWHQQLPQWFTNGNFDNATMLSILENHIDNVVGHFGDDCIAWDVVNEALNDDGTWRQSIWYNTTGTAYIYTAFRAANAAKAKYGLKTRLYYNDYNIENPGAKATAAQKLITDLQAAGIKVDGAGLQAHFIVGSSPSKQAQMTNMANFAALGVEVAVTELDVRLTLPATAEKQKQQVVDYYNTVSACANTPACVGVTVWDFDDTYSWIPQTFAGQGYGDLYFQPAGANTPLVRKAATDGVVQGWLNGTLGTYA